MSDASLTPPKLVRVENVRRLLAPFVRNFVTQVAYKTPRTLQSALRANPHLIHIMNHGPMLAPYVAAGAFAQQVYELGYGERVPFGVVHRRLTSFPVLREYIERNFNIPRPFGFEQIAERLGSGWFNDFVVLPEGSNEAFGDPASIRPFKSHRYLELALRLRLPVMVTVHYGTEDWVLSIRPDRATMQVLRYLQPGLYGILQRSRYINFQSVPLRLARLRMASQLIYPDLRYENLPHMPRSRHLMIREASEDIRGQMQRLLTQLRDAPDQLAD
jgi:hypothetical protein